MLILWDPSSYNCRTGEVKGWNCFYKASDIGQPVINKSYGFINKNKMIKGESMQNNNLSIFAVSDRIFCSAFFDTTSWSLNISG